MDCKAENKVHEYKNKYIREWWQTSAEFPGFLRVYDAGRQRNTEKKMDAVIEQMMEEVRKRPENIQKECTVWGSRIRSLLCIIGDEILELDGGGVDILLEGGYCKVTSDFIDKARSFDPSVKTRDIVQAMRNAWIMNCIQVLTGRAVEYTPELFAYSMLYPYTDNYLDAVEVDADKKLKFGTRLRSRLEGNPAVPENRYETKLFKLVEMIEDRYDRRRFPEVYESLLQIHDAQQKSLIQQKGLISPYESDILGASFEKGGASVLADAYLINGTLTEAQAAFMFGFGIFLQLTDDAQDVEDDLGNRHMTMFSQTAGKWPLDPLMNRLMNFMSDLLENDQCFNEPYMTEHKRLIRSSCTFLLLVSVANNSSRYGREYIKRLEKHSPFSFGYLRKLYRKASREFASLFCKEREIPMDSIMARALAESIEVCHDT